MWDALVQDHLEGAHLLPLQTKLINYSEKIKKKRRASLIDTDDSYARKRFPPCDVTAVDLTTDETSNKLEVHPDEANVVDIIKESILIRADIRSHHDNTKWGSYANSIKRTTGNGEPTGGTLDQLCGFLAKVSREQDPLVVAMCLEVLELDSVVDADTLVQAAEVLCTEHSPTCVVDLFIGVVCVLKYRSIGETCNRSWYRIFDTICKRKPGAVARLLLPQLIKTFKLAGGTLEIYASPRSPQYELFQRLYRQFFANGEPVSDELVSDICSAASFPFLDIRESVLSDTIKIQRVLCCSYGCDPLSLLLRAVPKTFTRLLSYINDNNTLSNEDLRARLTENDHFFFNFLAFNLNLSGGLLRALAQFPDFADKFSTRVEWNNDVAKLLSVVLASPSCIKNLKDDTTRCLTAKLSYEGTQSKEFFTTQGVSSLVHILSTKYLNLSQVTLDSLITVVKMCMDLGTSAVIKNSLAILRNRSSR